ncbi:MAG: carbohydrate kinase family protein, partial [Promethearchaeati archaeon]
SAYSDLPKKILCDSNIQRGGNGNNSAECLAKLEMPVKLISVTGKGVSWMVDELSQLGINTENIYQIEQKNPISTIIKSAFTTKIYLSPNLKEKMNFEGINLEESLFKDAKLIFITPYAQKYSEILEKASKLNKIIAITIEYQKINNSEQFRELVKEKTDLLFINLSEAKLIFENQNIEGIDSKLKNFSNIRIYTDGKNGSYIFSDYIRNVFIPTKEVEVIDRTGAGDSYAAGFLAKFSNFFESKTQLRKILSNDKKEEFRSKLKECGKYATFTAMYKISHQEAPTKDELKKFITELNNQ